MPEITAATLSMFENVHQEDRVLARMCAEGKEIGDLVAFLGGNGGKPNQLGERLDALAHKLLLPVMNGYPAKMQVAGDVYNAYLHSRNLPVVQPRPTVPNLVAVRSSEPASETKVTKETLLPTLDELVEKIKNLKPKLQETVFLVSKSGRGQRAAVAKTLGVTTVTVYNRMSAVVETCGLSSVGMSRARHLLNQACVRYKALDEEKFHRPSPQIAPKPHVVPAQLHSVEIEPASASKPEAMPLALSAAAEPQSTTPSVVAPALHVPQPAAAPMPLHSFGSGVVLTLPPNTLNVDIVAGTFNNGAPAPDIAREVRARKDRGLKPTFLVLSPRIDDPSVTLAQVVFVETDPRS
ncbi:MAG: hypothetical protein JWO43_527 [Candidatus Adlerbacteria bacterium]|nr:hypothetical protein [Candidatus Adlerbacteria bacterium]